MHRLIDKLLSLNAAEFAVMSFLFASLIGGTLLYFSEGNREIDDLEPHHSRVKLKSMDNGNEWYEDHTSIKKIKYKGIKFIDAVFISTSALCVTGLSTIDFSAFTIQGQIIVMILMQLGGFGIIAFTAMLASAFFSGLSGKVTFKTLIAETVDSKTHDVNVMLKFIFLYTIIFEGIAFLIMGFYLSNLCESQIINDINPWWWSLFHSISAFNNAGFSLMDNNLMNFTYDPVISLTISTLIILGGLGYPVLIAFYFYFLNFFRSHKMKSLKNIDLDISGIASRIQVKIAIAGTLFLLILGTALILWVEYDNALNSSESIFYQLLPAWFQSVTTRTAGFNTMNIGQLHAPTLFLIMVLMFIGANPAGTAGGVKIPTIAVLYGYLKDWFKRPNQPVVLFGERISKFAVSHAIRLFFFSTVFVAIITATINYIEREFVITSDNIFNFTKILFETVSAFGTVGLSMGFKGGVVSFSGLFTDGSKFLITITMLFGRLGPLVILAALPWKRKYAEHKSPDFENVNKIQIG